MPRSTATYRRIAARDTDTLHTIDPETGCWEWAGRRTDTGYGLVDVPGADGLFAGTQRVHRAYFEAYLAPIPGGLEVLHLCENRCCCNPHHLALGTHTANMKDAARKRAGTGRHAGEVAA